MHPAKQRLQEEIDQVDGRLNKLCDFIDSNSFYLGLDEVQKHLLRIQRSVMKSYLDVLQLRFITFED